MADVLLRGDLVFAQFLNEMLMKSILVMLAAHSCFILRISLSPQPISKDPKSTVCFRNHGVDDEVSSAPTRSLTGHGQFGSNWLLFRLISQHPHRGGDEDKAR